MPTTIATKHGVPSAGAQMTNIDIENAPSPVRRTSDGIEDLKTIIMICRVGLLMSLLLLTYGVDLSPGIF